MFTEFSFVGSTLIVWFFSSFYIFSRNWRILRHFPTLNYIKQVVLCLLICNCSYLFVISTLGLCFFLWNKCNISWRAWDKSYPSIIHPSIYSSFPWKGLFICTLYSSRSRDEFLKKTTDKDCDKYWFFFTELISWIEKIRKGLLITSYLKCLI